MKTIYQTIHGGFSLYPGEDKTPIQAEFIQTKCCGDFNATSYSPKPMESTRKESRYQVYFVPDAGADIAPDLKRGRTFFTRKDGFLFGAHVALTKMGRFITIPA